MKTLYTLLIGLSIPLLIVSCRFEVPEKGNGIITTKSIEVRTFEEIELSGNFEVIISRGTSPSVTIITDENLVELIDVSNDGDVLEIRTKKNIVSADGIKLDIVYDQLSVIDVQGAVSLKSKGVYSGEFLALNMSGAGTIDMAVDITALKVTISGAGAVQLSGEVKEQNISMSGAGGFDAFDLISETCKVSISGVGGARVNATEYLDASVSGVGGVSYKGNPEIKKNVSGIGTITKNND